MFPVACVLLVISKPEVKRESSGILYKVEVEREGVIQRLRKEKIPPQEQ